MGLVASIVDTEALIDVIWTALAGGIGVSLAFSIAIYGVARFADMRQDDRLLAASGFAVLTLAAAAVCAVAIGFGIAIMTSK